MSIALIKELQDVRPLLGEWGLSGFDYQVLESIAWAENGATHDHIREGKITDIEILPAKDKNGDPIPTVVTRRKQSYGRITRDRLANLTKRNFPAFRFTGGDKLAHRWGIADGTFDPHIKKLTARGFLICIPKPFSQRKKVWRRVNPDLIRDMKAQLPAFELAWLEKREADKKAREVETPLDLGQFDGTEDNSDLSAHEDSEFALDEDLSLV